MTGSRASIFPSILGLSNETLPFAPALREDLQACGLVMESMEDWQKIFLLAWHRLLNTHRDLGLYLETCLRCGACIDKCPYSRGGSNKNLTPLGRMELAAALTREHFNFRGAFRKSDFNRFNLSVQTLTAWYSSFFSCALCRRCSLYCPLGLDPAAIVRSCREVLTELGLIPQTLVKALKSYMTYGNAQNISPEDWTRTNASLEQRLEKDHAQKIKCPVDEYGAEILFLPSALDLKEHETTFAGYAKAFFAAGVSWTTSTHAADADNPGYFLNYRTMARLNKRILEAARELKVRYIIWGESGHGWQIAKNYMLAMHGSWSEGGYLKAPGPLHFYQWAWHLWRRGAFDSYLNREANDKRIVTLHDPCQYGRSTGLLQEPRELLRASCNFYYEMPAKYSGENTLCCGGGCRAIADQTEEIVSASLPLAKVIASMRGNVGVNCLATGCAQCKTALKKILARYGLELDVSGVAALFGNALMSNEPDQKGDDKV
ncbi:(Fe-S)-binding protein [Dethiosulfatarculus sandiegensis]|uniref:4Fe-4S ferredoxin-type domain-containing protein n=1 Tax=Dethiosulfatarculus sandiegensis TaxID=1429043 RepID=A0A0D2HKL6_9BACT|nr:(Fe-S)-binding protein [Dethiosulfatarculus sandiegensis]KIX11198.1 hypothetical protein X474_25270 [Dethiosulfatarculus sandiegensis]